MLPDFVEAVLTFLNAAAAYAVYATRLRRTNLHSAVPEPLLLGNYCRVAHGLETIQHYAGAVAASAHMITGSFFW